jgi:hypothetical protein
VLVIQKRLKIIFFPKNKRPHGTTATRFQCLSAVGGDLILFLTIKLKYSSRNTAAFCLFIKICQF